VRFNQKPGAAAVFTRHHPVAGVFRRNDYVSTLGASAAGPWPPESNTALVPAKPALQFAMVVMAPHSRQDR